ncbi:MAG: hypothetical protein QM611_04610 [Microbacterium sp.]
MAPDEDPHAVAVGREWIGVLQERGSSCPRSSAPPAEEGNCHD